MRTPSLASAALLFALAAPLGMPPAHAATPDAVQVTGAWSRASAGKAQTGVAYMTITGGATDDAVTGAHSPVADTTEVHESSMEGGMMHMRAIPKLPIPAGQAVALAPGGYHLMLIGLHKPLKAGQTFPITLTFAHAAPVTVMVPVKPIGAAALPDHGMDGHMDGHMGGHMGDQMGGQMGDHAPMH